MGCFVAFIITTKGCAVNASFLRILALKKEKNPLGAVGRRGQNFNYGRWKAGSDTSSRPRSDKQALWQSDAIRCACSSSPAGLPSQSPSVTAPPKGEPLAGRATSYWTPEARQGAKGRASLATEGRRFWTSAPCQAAAGLDSGALPFPRHRALLVQWKPDRHASGSPFGGAGERSETERARPLRQNKNTAIR